MVNQRDLTAAGRIEQGKAKHTFYFLVDMYFPTGTVSICNAPRNVVYEGRTYLTQKGGLVLSDYEENNDVREQDIKITLTGFPTPELAPLRQERWENSRCVIHRQFWNDVDYVVDTELYHEGLLTAAAMKIGDRAASATVRSSTILKFLFQPKGRRTNNTEQQAFFPADTIFDNADDSQRNFKWRRSNN